MSAITARTPTPPPEHAGWLLGTAWSTGWTDEQQGKPHPDRPSWASRSWDSYLAGRQAYTIYAKAHGL